MSSSEINQEFFKIELVKPNQECEILHYRKKYEKFQGDYAIVKAYSKDIRYANQCFYGIVDREYQTVFPFYLWKKVELFENQILAVPNRLVDESCNGKQVWHYQISNGKSHFVHFIGPYQKVNERIVITEDLDHEDGDQRFVYLYDVLAGKKVSNVFSDIGSFELVDGKRVAVAKLDLGKLNSIFKNPMVVMCYIDLAGNICSFVYNPWKNSFETVTKENFYSFCSEIISDALRQCSPVSDEKIVSKLKKSLLLSK